MEFESENKVMKYAVIWLFLEVIFLVLEKLIY